MRFPLAISVSELKRTRDHSSRDGSHASDITCESRGKRLRTPTIEWASYVPTKPLGAAGIASASSRPREDAILNPVKWATPERDADATSATDANAAPPATVHRERRVRRGSPRSGSDSASEV